MTSILTSGTAWSVQADTPDTDSKPPGGSKENHVSSGPNGTGETGQPIPQSPPDNSVGYFYGSTPENHSK